MTLAHLLLPPRRVGELGAQRSAAMLGGAWVAWRDWHGEHSRQQGWNQRVVAIATRFAMSGTLRGVWAVWVRLQREGKQNRFSEQLSLRLRARFTRNWLCSAWEAWRCNAQQQIRERRLLAKVTSRIRMSGVSRAVHTWRTLARQLRSCRRMVRLLSMRSLAAALRTWAGVVAGRTQRTRLMQRCVGKFQRAALGSALATWRQGATDVRPPLCYTEHCSSG